MDNITMELKANEIKALDNEIKALQNKMDSLKSEIKEEMDIRGVDEVITEHFTIRYKEVVSNRFDTKKFKIEDAETYNKFLTESVSRKFTIN